MPRSLSIRTRLTLGLAVGFTGIVAGACWFAASALSGRATAEFDAALMAQARALLSLTDQEAGRIEFDYQADAMPEYERKDEPDYFQFWLDDGLVLMRSRQLDRDLPLWITGHGPTAPVVADVALPDGRQGRMVQQRWLPRGPVDPRDGEDQANAAADPAARSVLLAVARSRVPLDQTLASVQAILLGSGGAAVALALLFCWLALALAFRPLAEIGAQVAALDADGLGARVRLERAPAELAPVVAQLNALLQRLETSFLRERRFAGNLAHELRTPIAELRSLASVAAKWPDDTEAIARFFADVRDVAGRMDGVIADLLLLARCQAGVERVQGAPVRLRQLIESVWHGLDGAARNRALRFDLGVAADLVVTTDPGKLRIVLANLLGNAVDYAHAGSEVGCRATVTGTGVELGITNDADPLTPGDMASAAEPFWRKDSSRSARDHAGLGLSLVSALAELLRLQLHIAQDPGGTFRVRLAGLVLDRTPSGREARLDPVPSDDLLDQPEVAS